MNVPICSSIGSQLHLVKVHLLPWASQVVLVVKNLPANVGDIRDVGSILGSGRSPGGEHGNPPHYSCLQNPMDRGAWWATVHRVPVLKTTEVTNIFPFIFTILEEETLNL